MVSKLKYNVLGKTKFNVSKLSFGSLTISPLQRDLSVNEGAKLIIEAYEKGVNILDTANLYENYPHIKEALKSIKREKFHIITKDYCYDKKTAKISLEKALKELGSDYVDGFLLHEQESEHTIRGHYEALEYLFKMKEKGYIKSLGISTHFIEGVKGAIKYSDILDIIHPIVNISGIGINDGNINQMIDAIKLAKEKNFGIYAMKPLGGGRHINDYEKALDFVLKISELDSIAIGMQNSLELEMNILKFNGLDISMDLKNKLTKNKRRLNIASWCVGCEKCVRRCKQNALYIENNKAKVDMNKCVLCGYCMKECEDFCIKII